jgi:hypothetical protein
VKKIGSNNLIPVSVQELFPGRLAAPLRSRLNTVPLKMFAMVLRASTWPTLASAPGFRR